MLVLSRKKNERVFINGNIEIVVVDIKGNKCRIGITAPAEISVHRSEVADAIERKQQRQEHQKQERQRKAG